MNKGIITVVSTVTGAVIGSVFVGKLAYKKVNLLEEKIERYITLFQMMDKWVEIKQEGKNLATYFQKRGYKKIAVYGMSRAGIALCNELENSGITVAYGIDKRADLLYADVDIFSIDNSLELVDAVVVTAVTYFEEIENKVSEKMDCPVISLEDILYEV